MGNPFQAHVSKWTVEDFRKRGYDVKGVGDLAAHKLVDSNKKVDLQVSAASPVFVGENKKQRIDVMGVVSVAGLSGFLRFV